MSIVWLSNGLFLVSGSSDQTFWKWNASMGECKLTIWIPDFLYTITISPNNKHIISCSGSCVDVWNVLTGSRILGPLGGHTGNMLTVTYTSNGCWILSGSAVLGLCMAQLGLALGALAWLLEALAWQNPKPGQSCWLWLGLAWPWPRPQPIIINWITFNKRENLLLSIFL